MNLSAGRLVFFDNANWVSGREHGTRGALEKLAAVLLDGR